MDPGSLEAVRPSGRQGAACAPANPGSPGGHPNGPPPPEQDLPTAARLLVELGVDPTTARCVAVLSRATLRSRDLGEALAIPQPRVSHLVRSLEARGWVTHGVEKTGRVGRPRHVYRLARTIEAIADDLRRAERLEYERRAALAQRLVHAAEQARAAWAAKAGEPPPREAHARDPA